jgi:hypothetical protein
MIRPNPLWRDSRGTNPTLGVGRFNPITHVIGLKLIEIKF